MWLLKRLLFRESCLLEDSAQCKRFGLDLDSAGLWRLERANITDGLDVQLTARYRLILARGQTVHLPGTTLYVDELN